MIQLPVYRPRLRRFRSATFRPVLPLTALAAHKVLGREKVRVLLETFASYALHRSRMLLRRPLAGGPVAAAPGSGGPSSRNSLTS